MYNLFYAIKTVMTVFLFKVVKSIFMLLSLYKKIPIIENPHRIKFVENANFLGVYTNIFTTLSVDVSSSIFFRM